MPSIEVPLIRPIARSILAIAGSRRMFRSPSPPETCRRCLRHRYHPFASAAGPMRKYQSDFLQTLAERGYIHQCSDFDGLDRLAVAGEVIAYVGYDCTAPSLHIGHLISIMMLTWLQQTGGKPIALMGGGTTRVGDPSGKDETRRILPIATRSEEHTSELQSLRHLVCR